MDSKSRRSNCRTNFGSLDNHGISLTKGEAISPFYLKHMQLKPSVIGLDGFCTLLLSTLVLIFTAGIWLVYLCIRVYVVARQTPLQPSVSYSTILLPGSALIKDKVQPVFRSRLDRCISLLSTNHAQKILLLGGLGSGNTVTEAAAGAQYLKLNGVSSHEIEIEDKSLHTLENFQYANQLIPSEHRNSLVLVSSRSHLHRCQVFANDIGLTFDLCAAEEEIQITRGFVIRLLIEGLYLHWFYTGRAWSRLTGNQSSLKRIS